MSLRQRIKDWLNPVSSSQTRKVQILLALLLLMVVLSVFYGLLTFVMSQKPSFRSENAPKPQPKTIETALHRVGGDENWRFKMEEDNRKLSEHISALEKLFHEGIKDKAQN